jgi:hypothetical protein
MSSCTPCTPCTSNISAPRRSARIAAKAAVPAAPAAAPIAAAKDVPVVHKDPPVPVPTRRSKRIAASSYRIEQFKSAVKGVSHADRLAFVTRCIDYLSDIEYLTKKERTVEREIRRINIASDLMDFIGQNIQHSGFGPFFNILIAKREELMNTEYDEEYLNNFWYKRAATRLYKTCNKLKDATDMALEMKATLNL